MTHGSYSMLSVWGFFNFTSTQTWKPFSVSFSFKFRGNWLSLNSKQKRAKKLSLLNNGTYLVKDRMNSNHLQINSPNVVNENHSRSVTINCYFFFYFETLSRAIRIEEMISTLTMTSWSPCWSFQLLIIVCKWSRWCWAIFSSKQTKKIFLSPKVVEKVSAAVEHDETIKGFFSACRTSLKFLDRVVWTSHSLC